MPSFQVFCMLLASLLPVIEVFTFVDGDTVIPDRLHCSTYVHSTLKGSNPDFQYYDVEEYIDLINQQSSIHVLQRVSDTNTIYFNSIFDRYGSSDPEHETRMDADQFEGVFLAYDSNKDVCVDDQSLKNWPFAPLQPIINDLFTQDNSTDETMSKLRDIIIGPCSLYLAAQANVNKLTYLRTEFSESSLTNVDVYESVFDDKQTNNDDDSSRHGLKLTVHVVGRSADKEEKLSNLATAIGKFDIVMISVSLANTIGSVGDNDSEKTNRDGESLIRVEFQILTEFIPSSLVGLSFDSGHYDYYASPLMRPIAIGCYYKESADIDSDLTKEFKIPTLQMSAEYFTSSGSKGISYVAFDGHNHILRVDRNGRKNLYDLLTRKSYHVAQYSAQDDPSDSLIIDSRPQCCVLDMKDGSLHTNAAFERLIGLSQYDSAQYLGSRTIESVSYEVYETEILYKGKERGYNLPILLEASEFSMPPEQKDKRYFVTYYMHESSARLNRLKRDPISTGNEKTRVLFPYFIELWELNTWTKKRELINRLEFSQFSWALDVQPSNDPATQDLSHIFNIDECLKDISSQAELSFFIKQNNSNDQLGSGMDRITALKRNNQLIREVVHENLAKVFGISPLNIARLHITVRQSSEIFVETKISELITCLLSFDPIGDISINDRALVKMHVYRNRHSMDECKLDSTTERRDHLAAFCPRKAVCLIINKTQELFKAIEDRRRLSINAVRNDIIPEHEDDLCKVMIFGCIPYFNKDDNVYTNVKDNLHKLSRDDFVFEVPTRDVETNEWRWFRYSGVGYSPQLHRLDSAGATLRHAEAANSLKGLRYTTGEEEPETSNANINVEVGTSEDTREENGLFRQCYIACHMDSLCGSFSYCVRARRHRNRYDCVLSSVRLTRERLDNIIGATTIDMRPGDNFKLTITSDSESQTMMMKRDAACNLHPKDYLSEYKIFKSHKPARAELPTVNDITSSDKKNSIEGRHLSLNDCAGLSFERNLWLNPVDSNFTYCSITSECFMSNDKGLKEAVSGDSDKHCYVFKRTHLTNYDGQSMQSLSIRVGTESGEASKSNEVLGRQYEENRDKMNLVNRFVGLSAEECARDCNLRKSNCLAFDFCRAQTAMTCLLYSIRSPLHESNAAYPMSPTESRFKSSGGLVSLTDVPHCTHYYLKDDHLQIRLQQIVSYPDKQGTGAGDKILDKRRKRLDDFETRLLDDDQRRNREEVPAPEGFDDSSVRREDSGDFYFSFVIMGLAFATLVIYRQETLKQSISLYSAIKNKLRQNMAREPDQHMIVELDTYPIQDTASGLMNEPQCE